MAAPLPPDSRAPATATGSALVRDMAHELRDALSPVVSSLDVLRLRKFAPDAARRATGEIDQALARALAAIDAFVLAAQCESGVLPLEMTRCTVREIVAAARGALSPPLASRCEPVSGAVDTQVNADLEQAAGVLVALLQYGEAIAVPGSLLGLHAAAGALAAIRVQVRIDPGTNPGEHWFQDFRGSRPGRMALRTARRLMALQGGGLELLVRAPDMCELAVTFADAAGTAPQDPVALRTPPPGGLPEEARARAAAAITRIIIVDDSAEVRRAYREPLAGLGYVVTEAADAEQALRALEADTAPEVALIDIHLPKMDGFRLAREIRARGAGPIRLIMLSGITLDPTTRRLSREAGFDDCFDKMAGPLALHRLLQGSADAAP